MKHVEHIVFVVARQPLYRDALRWAARLASDADAELTVLDVFEAMPDWRRHIEIHGEDVDLQPLFVDEVTRAWDAAVTETLGEGHTASTEVLTGHPVRTTIEHIERLGGDLIVRGELPAPSPLDPVTTRLIRSSPVPVLIARPRVGRDGPVLAAIDVEGMPGDDELNQRVLEVAAALAGSTDVELHLVHAWDLPEERVLRSSTFLRMSEEEVDRLLERTAERHTGLVHELVGTCDLAGLRATTHVLRGDPPEVIAATARSIDAQIVVVGTVGRRGLSRLVLGNTAEGVLAAVETSLLAVKPPAD